MTYKDDERVLVNYQKIFRTIEKRGLNQSTICTAIGKSPAYISAMYSKDSKMLYGDLKKIARILYIHGATKLVRMANDKQEDEQIDENLIAEIKANMTSEERIAEALETIAGLLIDLLKSKK